MLKFKYSFFQIAKDLTLVFIYHIYIVISPTTKTLYPKPTKTPKNSYLRTPIWKPRPLN
jgi:hypothetical protein